MALILREMDRRKEILEEEDRTRNESVFSRDGCENQKRRFISEGSLRGS